MDQGSQYLPSLFTHLDLTKVGVKTVFLHLNNSFSELTHFLKAFGSNPSFENLYLYFNSEEKRSSVQKKVKNFTIQLRQISLRNISSLPFISRNFTILNISLCLTNIDVDLNLLKPRHLARTFLEISYSRFLSNCNNLSFTAWGGRSGGSYGWIICFESLLILNGGFERLSWKNSTNKADYLLPFTLLLVKHIGETVDVAELKLNGTSDLKYRVSRKLKILKSMGYVRYNNFVIIEKIVFSKLSIKESKPILTRF
eukprot:snap_masked-scaffold_54-processed-gene-1.87-mRNA-1 protein AED:1.00 eAED:1.00 QI:0/0/0/0/1/1/4/0/254